MDAINTNTGTIVPATTNDPMAIFMEVLQEKQASEEESYESQSQPQKFFRDDLQNLLQRRARGAKRRQVMDQQSSTESEGFIDEESYDRIKLERILRVVNRNPHILCGERPDLVNALRQVALELALEPLRDELREKRRSLNEGWSFVRSELTASIKGTISVDTLKAIQEVRKGFKDLKALQTQIETLKVELPACNRKSQQAEPLRIKLENLTSTSATHDSRRVSVGLSQERLRLFSGQLNKLCRQKNLESKTFDCLKSINTKVRRALKLEHEFDWRGALWQGVVRNSLAARIVEEIIDEIMPLPMKAPRQIANPPGTKPNPGRTPKKERPRRLKKKRAPKIAEAKPDKKRRKGDQVSAR